MNGRVASPPGVRGLTIRRRLLLSLLALTFALILVPALLLESAARQSLEAEMASRLESVAGAASLLIDPSLIPGILTLDAEGGGRTRARLGERLSGLRAATDVRRIFIVDGLGRNQLDTDSRAVPGALMVQARAHRALLDRAAAGAPVSSPLFKDPSGQMRKTAYAALRFRGETVGFVGIEADARFLSEVGRIRRRIIWIALVGFVAASALSVGLSRGLTRPLGELVRAARFLGGGDLDRPIPPGRADEVGFLARTLEDSRVRLAERDRTLRGLVAGIAHEIRNPLGGIQIYAELLENDATLSDGQKARVKKILREIHRLGEIVEEFLAYARPQAPERAPFDLREIMLETVDLLQGLLSTRQVGVVMVPPEPPVLVRADPRQIRQVVLNLLRNAAEASPPDGTIRLVWEAQGPTVLLSIEDDGPGVPPDRRDRVFEPFFTTKPDGAGLGLAIVRHLVEQNGGRVHLDAGARGGCRFTVRLEGVGEGPAVG